MSSWKRTDQYGTPGLARIKLLTDSAGQPTGEVEFYAAIFGNVDKVSDRILPGAFTRSLEAWTRSGNPIPMVYSHKWDSVPDIVGWADPKRCVQDGRGLLIRGHLDIDINPNAKLLWHHMDRRIINDASFAFEVPPGGEKRAKDGANNLIDLDILEVGPTLAGCNPLTEVVSTKSTHVGRKILAGSQEERQAELGFAVQEKFGFTQTLGVPGDGWVYIEGTYDDHVIACVVKDGESTYYSIPYMRQGADDVVLGKEEEVTLVAETTEETKSAAPEGVKAFAWTDADGEGHIPIDDADQVRAALNLAQNDWTFRGNRMKPAPPEEERAGVIRRIVAAAHKFDIETELEAPKDVAGATSETGAGAGNVADSGQYGGVVKPDYEDDEEAKRQAGVKTGRRNSGSDQTRLQAAHDALVEAGAACALPEGVEVKDPAREEDDVEVKDAEVSGDEADTDVAEPETKPEEEALAKAAFFREMGDIDGEIAMLAKAAELRVKYSEDQERDERGRFGSGGGDSGESTGGGRVTGYDGSGGTNPGVSGESTGHTDSVGDNIHLGDTVMGGNGQEATVIGSSETGVHVMEVGSNTISMNVDPSILGVVEHGHSKADTPLPDSTGGTRTKDDIDKDVPDLGAPAEARKPEDVEVVEKDTVCSTCDGTGKIRDGNVECPDCGGTGKVAAEEKSASTDAGDSDDSKGKVEEPEGAKAEDPAEVAARRERTKADIADLEKTLQ